MLADTGCGREMEEAADVSYQPAGCD